MKKKILVTGGSGFIGSNMVRELIKKNYEVAITTKYDSVYENIRLYNLWKKVKVIECDLRHSNSISKINDFNPKIILHFAAYNDVKGSFLNYNEALESNTLGTANLLENLKIPYLQIQGTNPFFTWMTDEEGNWTQDYSAELNKLLGYIRNLDYMFSMDSEKFVGWPCFEKLGGYRASNVIRDEKYRMGAEDSHPNEEGHRIIANHLLEEWNKIYK